MRIPVRHGLAEAAELGVSVDDKRRKRMSSERATSGAKLAMLGAALLLLVAACGEEAVEPAEQGAAPTMEQPAEGEQPEQQQ